MQHCFISRPSESNVSEGAGIEPRTVVNRLLDIFPKFTKNNSAEKYVYQIATYFLLLGSLLYLGTCIYKRGMLSSTVYAILSPDELLL